jgi:AraC-like DNA-binding protein
VAATNEFVVGQPHPRLRPFVGEYTGYRVSGLEPGVHAGLPSRTLTLIVAFDDPLDVTSGHDVLDRDTYWAMVGGLHSKPAAVRHDGRQHGVQLGLTPLGATALLGTPAGELAKEVVHLDEVVSDYAPELVERLTVARSWRARWAALDDVLLRHLRDVRPPAPEVEQAWVVLTSSHGTVNVADLAFEVGWSRRHLAQQFRRSFGLSPKTMARVLRFERAQLMLRLPTRPSLASIAHACGYADQAHMTRDWNEFAGAPPTEWMNDETIPFVQDDAAADPSS